MPIAPKIMKRLWNKNAKIITKKYLLAEISKLKTIFKIKFNEYNLLNYLRQHNYIKRIFLDHYYINSFKERYEDYCEYSDFELLTKVLNSLEIKWYVGLNNALNQLNLIWQAPRTLTIINNRFSGLKKILNLKVKFHKTNSKRIRLGLITKITKKHKFPYKISNPEKTAADILYFKKTLSLPLIEKKNLNIKKFRYYYKMISKK